MALSSEKSDSDGRRRGLFRLPFRNSSGHQATSSSSSHFSDNYIHQSRHFLYHGPPVVEGTIINTLQRSLRSAIKIKNTSNSHVAFKFQTTEPKSCFMRPAGAILPPGEEIIATVFKFVEPPENNEKPMEQRSGVKFKIMSLKIKVPTDYMPELFEEQKDHVSEEQVMRVVFLDPENSNPMMEKLKSQLAEADAADEAKKKAAEVTSSSGPKPIGEGLVIDEWKQRRERYLAQQQGVDLA
ncbi:Vesicle-associated protein 4-3 [Hirschfeldia incana]|nr:Vesicle-associated protein 4-3 [Hirschfeldia incana]